MHLPFGTTLKAFLPRKGSFVANSLTLMSGNTFYHLIIIAASPILTRLYGPKEFGLWAIFISLTNVVGGITAARYEFAIMLPQEDQEAANILGLCLIINPLLCGVFLMVVAVSGQPLAQVLRSPELAPWLWLAPFSIFLTGIFNTFNFWSTRKKQFHIVAIANVSLSLGIVATQLLAGVVASPGPGGLLAGQIIGQVAGTGIMAGQVWRNHGKFLRASFSTPAILAQVRRYKKFPLLFSWATLMNNLARQVPVWFIALGFGPQNAGFFSLAYRTVALPTVFIAKATSQVFFQRATEQKNLTGDSSALTKKVALIMTLIPALPFLTIMLWGPEIFAFIFGEAWQIAGRFAAILCPLSWASFVVGPLTMINAVHETQEIGLIGEAGLLCLSFGVFYVTTKHLFPIETILYLYSSVILLWRFVQLMILLRISQGKPLFYQRRVWGL